MDTQAKGRDGISLDSLGAFCYESPDHEGKRSSSWGLREKQLVLVAAQ